MGVVLMYNIKYKECIV